MEDKILDDVNANFSLNELEKNDERQNNLKSGLTEKCNLARSKKLKNLSNEEVRILLGQHIGLHYTVPLALNLLESNPLCAGDLYAGDILVMLLMVEREFWHSNPALNNRLVEIRITVEEIYSTIAEEIMPIMEGIEFK